jgi:hypothetical protein
MSPIAFTEMNIKRAPAMTGIYALYEVWRSFITVALRAGPRQSAHA